MPWINRPPKKHNISDKRKERQKIYATDRWRKLRLIKLQESPLCEICLQNNVVTSAEHVHHLDSFMNYDGLRRIEVAYDYNNLLSICEFHHNQIHNKKRPLK
jgi:5-methylcytosine-specific restriction protein A